MELKSVEEEAADCRKAFEGVEVGLPVWHCHHEQLFEPLMEQAEKRIDYILSSKSRDEQAIRLRLFRPAKNLPADADRQKAYADWQKAYADMQKADADWDKAYADRQKAYADMRKEYADYFKKHESEILALHAEQCPGCPWDGRSILGGNI